MTATSTRLLTHEELRALGVQIFRERRSTLDEAAAPYSIDALQGHVATIWADVRLAVEEAPDTAFERQPDDVDGGDVWSVGQVVSHLCDTQVRSQGFWEDLLQAEVPAPPTRVYELHGAQLLDRVQSLAALDSLDSAWSELMTCVPLDFDPERRGLHPVFGSAGIKGALLVFSYHLDSHLYQIRDLYEA
jgi:hypothetical protein